MLIYIIEDDAALARGMAFTLKKENYEVTVMHSCREARTALGSDKPDLVLLDWNLPDGDGLAFCEEIRACCAAMVLMITARDMEIDEVMCLESGADDYIAKPFSLAVLKARIAALLRRQGRQQEGLSQLVSGAIRMDVKEMKAYRGWEELELSMTEYRLLKLFVENRNQVLTKDRILSCIWDASGAYVEENTLMVNIRRLRMKIEEDPSKPDYIKTVHGVGYMWEDHEDR